MNLPAATGLSDVEKKELLSYLLHTFFVVPLAFSFQNKPLAKAVVIRAVLPKGVAETRKTVFEN